MRRITRGVGRACRIVSASDVSAPKEVSVGLDQFPEVAATSTDDFRTTQRSQKEAREAEDCGSDAPLQWSKQEMSAAGDKVTKTFGS